MIKSFWRNDSLKKNSANIFLLLNYNFSHSYASLKFLMLKDNWHLARKIICDLENKYKSCALYIICI
jgi:hypothetical protein